MRIMLLVPNLPLDLNSVKGGVHSAVCNLLHGFRSCDVTVRVVSINSNLNAERSFLFSENIQIIYIPEGTLPFHSLNYLFFSSGNIKKHIKFFRPHIVHLEEGNSFLLATILRFSDRKNVLTIHGMTFAEAKIKTRYREKITWYFNGLIQSILLPRNVVHLSQYSFEQCQDKRIRKQTIIPNAITSDYFNLPLKAETSNSLLFIGVINRRKNLLFLLYSLNQLILEGRKFNLSILGDFDDQLYKREIVAFIQQHDLSSFIEFHGWVPQCDVMRYIAKADILVLPSIQETLPMAIAESMAAGKVVVAASVGGIPEMINHSQNGFLINEFNSNSLTSILENLYDNNEVIQLISKRARIFASKYNCKIVANNTIQFYKSILS